MTLTTAEWATLAKLLDDGLDLPRDEQAAWLKGLALDPHMRAALQQMLDREDVDLLQTLPKFTHVAAPLGPGGDREGLLVGPYRLIRELGRGGMGAVWLADRVDGALTRQVALKLPHGIHDAQFRERFRRERDILASFAHPNIAQIYDAGAAEEGKPFIALEYVEGSTLVEDCDARKLGVRERLEVFLQVLGAVQYAHSHLVIHRDLKPGNILVAKSGEVKLLDFGIAKLIAGDGEDAQETELTQQGGRALTLDYAAPEQILGRPVSTATDIYSLGVVLFELLAGERPYSLKRDFKVAPQEAILTVRMPRPSQIVKGPTAKKLSSQLEGDLDTIVLKALKTEPAERYASADAFAQDIRRYLQGEAVLAQPDNVAYRARKFVLRHKIPVFAAAAVVVALAAGLTVALWQARVASREARTSRAVQNFLEDIFRANSSDQPDPVKARQTSARELLDIGARKIKSDLNSVPEAKLEVLGTLAGMYSDLGVDDEAVALNRERLTLAKAVHGPRSLEVAKILVELGKSMHASNFASERHGVLEEAKKILDQNGDSTSATRSQLLTALAQEYNSTDRAKAAEYAHEAVVLNRRKPPSPDLIEALFMEGMLRSEGSEFDLALPLFAEAIPLSKKVGGDPNEDLPRLYAYQGEAFQSLMRLHEAEQSMRNAYNAARALNGPDHVDSIQTGMRLGKLLVDLSLSKEGLETLERAKTTVLKTRGPDDPFHTPTVLFEYGSALARVGSLEDGLGVMKQAIAYRRKSRPGTFFLAQMLEVESGVLIDIGGYAEAEKLLDEASAIRGSVTDQSDRLNVTARIKLLMATMKPQEAASVIEKSYDKWPGKGELSITQLRIMRDKAELARVLGDAGKAIQLAEGPMKLIANSPERSYLKQWEAGYALVKGEAYLAQNRPTDALPLLTTAVEIRAAVLDPLSPLLAEAMMALAECQLQLGNRDRAKQLLDRSNGIVSAHLQIGEQYKKPLRRLTLLYSRQ